MLVYKCDFCGKDFDNMDAQENFSISHYNIGYGSCFDGLSIDVNLCCGCFDKMMGSYVIPKLNNAQCIKDGNGDCVPYDDFKTESEE